MFGAGSRAKFGIWDLSRPWLWQAPDWHRDSSWSMPWELLGLDWNRNCLRARPYPKHPWALRVHNYVYILGPTTFSPLCWTPILSIDRRHFYCVFMQICAWLLDPSNAGPPFYQSSFLCFSAFYIYFMLQLEPWTPTVSDLSIEIYVTRK